MKIKLIKNTFFNEANTKKRLWIFIQKADKLSMGKECLLAEKKFAAFNKRKYCTIFNSGSSANLALVQAYLNLGLIKKGDKVGVSALTWSTTIMPLIQLGLIPIPIDIDLETLNVGSSNLIKSLRQNKFKAYFSTNVLGFSADLDNIKNICRINKVLFFEDNCESFGSEYRGVLLGGYGHASTFSFYVGHHLSTIEGGAVCTDDKKLYEMLVLVRAHGWDRNLPPIDQSKLRISNSVFSSFYDKYTFYDLSFNLRPTEITGFLLNENLHYANEIIRRREDNFMEIYTHAKRCLEGMIYPLDLKNLNVISNFAIPIVCKKKYIFEKLVSTFIDNNVEIRPIIAGNLTLQPFFKKYIKTKYNVKDLPNTNIVHNLGFYFGNNPDITREEINYIKSIFSNFQNKQ